MRICKMLTWVFVAVVLGMVTDIALAQTKSSSSNTSASTSPLETVVSLDPATVRLGSTGTIIITLRNKLSPRQPISLTAVVTYTAPDGSSATVASAPVQVQVVQPITVRSIDIGLPNSWSWASGITMPYPVDITLLEGQEQTIRLQYIPR